MAQNENWTVWKGILEQMDRACKPSAGLCANACKNKKLPFHIYCDSCRVANRGYALAQVARG